MSTSIVAIDGPAGSGKSSVSKAVARNFGFGYLDTGAAYRALACLVQDGLPLSKFDTPDFAHEIDYAISTDPDEFWVRINGKDVTSAIRSSAISEQVSSVAQKPEVRKFMKTLTHELANKCTKPGIVIEGRDITTVVYPEAESRILLTAREEVRLARRSSELSDSADVKAQVTSRDAADSKVVNFQEAAPGVTLIDSSDMDFDQTIAAVSDRIKKDLGNHE